MPPVRAVIFDIDDTLLDLTAAAASGLRAMVARASPALSDGAAFDEALAFWRQLELWHVGRFLGGECTLVEQRRSRVREFTAYAALSIGTRGEALDAWFADFTAACETDLRLFPEVPDALATISARGVVIGALSNNIHAVQRRRLRQAGILDHFAALVCADDLAGAAAKPDSGAFLAACAALGSQPGQTVYLGDDLANDALAARAAGLIGVWIDRRPPLRDAGSAEPAEPAAGSLVPTATTLTEFADWLARSGFLPMTAQEVQ